MTSQPVTLTHDIERLHTLQATIAEATTEANSIKQRLRDAFAELPGTHDINGHKLSITIPRRFSEDEARRIVPAELLEAATISTLDAKRLKELLPPVLWDQCTVASTPRVELR